MHSRVGMDRFRGSLIHDNDIRHTVEHNKDCILLH
jgi:hypothetical protein